MKRPQGSDSETSACADPLLNARVAVLLLSYLIRIICPTRGNFMDGILLRRIVCDVIGFIKKYF
jgi:hypothetical protein